MSSSSVPTQPGKTKKMEDGSGAITNKSMGLWVGTLIVSMVGIGTLHAQFVVPSVLQKAADMMDAKIDRHEARPHDGTITTDRWGEVLARLSSIDERLRDLETQK